MTKHNIFWGSHGCSRQYPHYGPCACEHLNENTLPYNSMEGDQWLLLTLDWTIFGNDITTAKFAPWFSNEG